MTTLRFEEIQMPGANLSKENGLPDIYNNASLHGKTICTDKIAPEERVTFDKLRIHTTLPYKPLISYDRARETKTFKTAVLENEFLRATFLPELGGRLWSLFNKKENREILYVNDVFQPANLGAVNAWFAGGVEWNCGFRGHTPLGCENLFTRKATNSAGQPVLKMYEYERITCVAYSVCAALEGDVLLVHIRVENTEDYDKWVYWWSNAAVVETKKTRVLVPAKESFYCGYIEGQHVLDEGNYPYNSGRGIDDTSYPAEFVQTDDLFYKIGADEKKWIASVDEEGKGLLHFSDDTLKCRKLFAWGRHPGGQNWNRWLSDRGENYIELQGGLAPTQQHVATIKGNSSIEWVEGYCLASGRPEKLHGGYDEAVAEIAAQLDEKIKALGSNAFDIVSEDALETVGSGWGALENMCRKTPVSLHDAYEESSLGTDQEDWLRLLRGEPLPHYPADAPVNSFVLGKEWAERIEKTAQGSWYEHYQLGVLAYTEKEYDKAKNAYAASLTAQENAWALRDLARIEWYIDKNQEVACGQIQRALAIKPEHLGIVRDCADILIKSERYEAYIDMYAGLSDALKADGRMQMLLGVAYMRLKKLELAKQYLNEKLVVPDIKEGEYSVSHFWFELYRQVLADEKGVPVASVTDEELNGSYPLPQCLDFRQDI